MEDGKVTVKLELGIEDCPYMVSDDGEEFDPCYYPDYETARDDAEDRAAIYEDLGFKVTLLKLVPGRD